MDLIRGILFISIYL